MDHIKPSILSLESYTVASLMGVHCCSSQYPQSLLSLFLFLHTLFFNCCFDISLHLNSTQLVLEKGDSNVSRILQHIEALRKRIELDYAAQ